MRAGIETQTKTVVDVLWQRDDMRMFLDGLRGAGLEERLRGQGPFTVFAPCDEAFGRLAGESVRKIFDDPRQLSRFFAHHIVPEKFTEEELRGRWLIRDFDGDNLSISDGGAVAVNGARIVEGNIECSNGVIHVVDSVLLL